MRPLALPCAALALLLVGTAQAGAAAPTTCPSYEYKLSGTSWSARAISVRRVECGAARKLIRSYSRPLIALPADLDYGQKGTTGASGGELAGKDGSTADGRRFARRARMRRGGTRYLVTGGSGFIGSHLVEALVARGDSVVILDDLSTGDIRNVEHLLGSDRVVFHDGSILDEELVDDCMRSVDACFHLASAVGVKLVVSHPVDTLLTNVRGTDIVMAAAVRRGRRLLFTSTSEIYGKNCSDGLDEQSDRILGSPFKARWGYSTAKAFGEALAHGYSRDSGAEIVVARIFNTAGPRQKGAYGMVIPRFVQRALDGRPLTVYGTGAQSRCFVHVADTVRGLLMLAGSDGALGQVFNVGNADEVSIVELAAKVIERTGSISAIERIDYQDAYGDGFEELGRRRPDATQLRELTGWRPERSLDDIIDDVVAHERSKALAALPALEIAS
jgi:UDP-glucose 4-epimerase